MTESPIDSLFGIPGLTTPQRLVLLAFGVHDEDNSNGPSITQLAHMTGLTIGAVKASITALQKLGLLETEEVFDANGDPLPAIHTVNFDRANRLRQEGRA